MTDEERAMWESRMGRDHYKDGFNARLDGQPLEADPFRRADGSMIHVNSLDWAHGWKCADKTRQKQPDLFDELKTDHIVRTEVFG